MYHSFLIHSSADGHLGCFHINKLKNKNHMMISIDSNLRLNMKPPWSLSRLPWSLGRLFLLLAWIKVTYLHWGGLSFSASAQTVPYTWTSFVVQLVKNMPAMLETSVQFLGWEDPLEKGKTIYSSILAWRIPWTYSPRGHKELDTNEWFSLSLLLSTRIYTYKSFF